jgi:hypothetical protein
MDAADMVQSMKARCPELGDEDVAFLDARLAANSEVVPSETIGRITASLDAFTARLDGFERRLAEREVPKPSSALRDADGWRLQ